MQPTLPVLSLLVAAAVHLGFQLVVTAVVYPALVDVPDEQWREHHDRHSRRIAPLVVVVYSVLVVSCAWVLWSGPTLLEWGALAACAAAFGLTAVVAAPAHSRLGAGRDPVVLARLLRADRLRLPPWPRAGRRLRTPYRQITVSAGM